MIGFLATAVAMSAITAAWLFYPLKRKEKMLETGTSQKTNLEILRDQIEELDADFSLGVIGEKERDEARAELNRRAIEEAEETERRKEAPQKTSPEKDVSPVKKTQQILWSVSIFLAVILVAGTLYTVIGTPAALNEKAVAASQTESEGSPHPVTEQDFEAAINGYAQKMAAEPDNIEGWMLLARSYGQMGKYQQAAASYEHILSRIPDEANVLADYADLLGVMQQGNLSGKPMALLARALKVDAKHWKALALAGTEAFDREDYATAEKYWIRAKDASPGNAEVISMLEAGIKEAQAKRAGK